MYWLAISSKCHSTHSLPHPKNERQYSMNDFKSYTLDNQRAVLSCNSKENQLVGFIAEKANKMLIALSQK
jgi:hypothetical protein